MSHATPKPSERSWYWAGFREGLPFLLVVMPFGLLFGVISIEAGLTPLQTMAFSSVVFAGASQFAALQLMVDNAPVFIVLATALAVNLRMAMYSASLSLWLGKAPLWQRALVAYVNVDQSYAVSINRYEDQPELTLRQRIAFFFGAVSPVCPMWVVATALGVWLGAGIPDWMALDFAVPICFLAIIAPMMRTLAHMVAAVVSIVLALLLAGLPFNLGLLVAALVAMAVGARIELWHEARAPA
ncbi:MAG: AzlC family ABC transporter permease [Pseudomonadota bacterium]